MARNKYPEETVKKILDVAEGLFMTKGYEHTTMADIVGGLGGLTKGAVYHHFKSKEDVFEAVFERANRPVVAQSEKILADRSLSGLEKIRALDEVSSQGPSAEMWDAMRPSSDPIKSARILAREYLDLFDTAHRFIAPAVEEGITDGSIAATHPRETAEVMLLLANLWMVPLFNPFEDEGAYARRVEVFLRVMHALGVDVVDWDALSEERLGRMDVDGQWTSWAWAEAPAGAGAGADVAAPAARGGNPSDSDAPDGFPSQKQPEVD